MMHATLTLSVVLHLWVESASSALVMLPVERLSGKVWRGQRRILLPWGTLHTRQPHVVIICMHFPGNYLLRALQSQIHHPRSCKVHTIARLAEETNLMALSADSASRKLPQES